MYVHCVTVSNYERRHFHFEETQLNLQRGMIIYSSTYASLLKMNSTKRPFIQNLVFLLVLHFFAIEQSSIFTKSIEKVFLFCSDSSFISLIRNKSRCLSTFYGPLIYMKLQKKEPRMGSTTHIRVKHFLESKSKFSRLQFLQNIF